MDLMEAINSTRRRVWEKQPRGFLSQALIDTDSTIAGTLGECKGGIGLSYKGIWGYAPLIISLANTRFRDLLLPGSKTPENHTAL